MKKFMSLFLSAVLLLSVFSVLTFSGSAVTLDESKIYVKVNDNYYEVEKGDVFTYESRLEYPEAIVNLDFHILFDEEALRLVPDVDEYGDVEKAKMFPLIKNLAVYNFKKSGEIIFNFSKDGGLMFDESHNQVFCGKFEVITDNPGVYEISSYYRTLCDVNLNKIVYEQIKYLEYTQDQLVVDVEPLTQETQVPTIPTTFEPTDDTSSQTIPPTVEPSVYPPTSGPSEPLPSDPDDGPTETPSSEDPTEEITEPTIEPTEEPTVEPTEEPTIEPTEEPTVEPTEEPTIEPTVEPTVEPTEEPTIEPTEEPTVEPTEDTTQEPTDDPIVGPTQPSEKPTDTPTDDEPSQPSEEPTEQAKLGDVDLNGNIEIVDATRIQLYLAEFVTLSQKQLAVADTNHNSKIDILDATRIQMLLAEFIDEL